MKIKLKRALYSKIAKAYSEEFIEIIDKVEVIETDKDIKLKLANREVVITDTTVKTSNNSFYCSSLAGAYIYAIMKILPQTKYGANVLLQ